MEALLLTMLIYVDSEGKETAGPLVEVSMPNLDICKLHAQTVNWSVPKNHPNGRVELSCIPIGAHPRHDR